MSCSAKINPITALKIANTPRMVGWVVCVQMFVFYNMSVPLSVGISYASIALLCWTCAGSVLTHLPWTNWSPFWQTIFSIAISWMKMMIALWIAFHCNIFPWVQLAQISQHWCREWLGAEQVTSHGPLARYVNCGLRMRRECRERFPRHRFQRKPLVRDPGMHHDTCVSHVPWCMSGSLTRGGGENIPGIPGACATRNFTYLVRDPLPGSMMSYFIDAYMDTPLKSNVILINSLRLSDAYMRQ